MQVEGDSETWANLVSCESRFGTSSYSPLCPHSSTSLPSQPQPAKHTERIRDGRTYHGHPSTRYAAFTSHLRNAITLLSVDLKNMHDLFHDR